MDTSLLLAHIAAEAVALPVYGHPWSRPHIVDKTKSGAQKVLARTAYDNTQDALYADGKSAVSALSVEVTKSLSDSPERAAMLNHIALAEDLLDHAWEHCETDGPATERALQLAHDELLKARMISARLMKGP